MAKETHDIPVGLADLYASLFGKSAEFAKPGKRTRSELKKILKQIADELWWYFQDNVQTDGQHFFLVCAAIASATHALKAKGDFWPGYCAGITRLALLLMGDVPDHRRRKGGRRSKDFYSLRLKRSLLYYQDADQKVRVLFGADQCQAPKLSKAFREYMSEFHDACGFGASYKDFWPWFRQQYPEDYSQLF